MVLPDTLRHVGTIARLLGLAAFTLSLSSGGPVSTNEIPGSGLQRRGNVLSMTVRAVFLKRLSLKLMIHYECY